jgi:cyclase
MGFPYTKGLHDLGRGCFAWLQPDGGWGYSNAGLVTDAGASLLVDTLFDLALTREMLEAMRRATPAAARIGALVNTHANGDHCYGNALVREAEIIASKATAEEMREVPPAVLLGLLENAAQLGPAGAFFHRVFGAFDFHGIEPVLPTRTFEGELELAVGGKRVRLLEVGPAHTRGDVLVHVPADRIRACERIEAMDVDVVVPGHGPITDRGGARRVREYLAFVHAAARERFDSGLSARDAARDIDLGVYADWRDPERLAVNVDTAYREFSGAHERTSPLDLFARMAELARR